MTQTIAANTLMDMLRSISVTLLDRPAFWLLSMMYQIFFNVASAEIFTNATVKNFFGRIQLIIGVFMVFKLAITIIQGIVNPDKLTDKQNGFSSIITRIIFSLVMLTLIVPINIPSARTEYEIELNNNGLLFGTLYSLQNRLLTNNTLGRLILGTTDNNSGSSSSDSTLTGADKQAEILTKSSNIFASTILKGFLRINLREETEKHPYVDPGEGKTLETDNNNRMCPDIDKDTLAIYTKIDVDPQTLLNLVNASCSSAKDGAWWGESAWNTVSGFFKRLKGDDRYVFAYIPILGFITALVFCFILLGFTIDIAVRAVKLAVLRLIAPIPIISYIQPESAKKGAFASWVKALTSTYLDLFLRLAIVYFVIFLIQDMIANGIIITTGTGMIGILSSIMLWIGLFFFAKQAPKFIKDVLGIQGTGMQNIGLSGLMGGTAMLAGGGGASGFLQGAMQSSDGEVQAYNQGKAAPGPMGTWHQNSELMAKIRTGDKDAHGGLSGRLQDRMNYRTREKAAGRYGVGNQDLADADYMRTVRQAEADAVKREFAFAEQKYKNGQISEKAYQDAYDKNEAYQTEYAKANAAFDKMDKDRQNFDIRPRVRDKREQKYKIRQALNNDLGTHFKTTNNKGTYRSPLATVDDARDPAGLDIAGVKPRSDDVVKGQIQNGHKRDLKNFNGTTDDQGIFRS